MTTLEDLVALARHQESLADEASELERTLRMRVTPHDEARRTRVALLSWAADHRAMRRQDALAETITEIGRLYYEQQAPEEPGPS